MGYERVVRPIIVADFGEQSLGNETYESVEPGEQPFLQMRGGGFLDTELAQKEHDWTDDERKLVEKRLVEIAENNPDAPVNPRMRAPGFGDVKIYEEPKAVPPWKTYDDMHHSHVAKFAEEAGLVAEALHYEQRTKQRKSVIEALQELVERDSAEADLTAA